MLDPLAPGFLRYILIDALAERVSIEGHLGQTFGFFLQFHAKNGVGSCRHIKP
jgi:hypothetical protein